MNGPENGTGSQERETAVIESRQNGQFLERFSLPFLLAESGNLSLQCCSETDRHVQMSPLEDSLAVQCVEALNPNLQPYSEVSLTLRLSIQTVLSQKLLT